MTIDHTVHRSKALTEEGFASLGYETIILRPGFLTERDVGETRVLEAAFRVFTGLLAHFTPNVEIKVLSFRFCGTFRFIDADAGLEDFTSGKGHPDRCKERARARSMCRDLHGRRCGG